MNSSTIFTSYSSIPITDFQERKLYYCIIFCDKKLSQIIRAFQTKFKTPNTFKYCLCHQDAKQQNSINTRRWKLPKQFPGGQDLCTFVSPGSGPCSSQCSSRWRISLLNDKKAKFSRVKDHKAGSIIRQVTREQSKVRGHVQCYNSYLLAAVSKQYCTLF